MRRITLNLVIMATGLLQEYSHQGGTTASIYDTTLDVNYPIAFKSKVLWGGVTIDHSGISSGGLAAYFQSAGLKRGKVTSDAISDAVTAEIKYIVIGF